MAKFSLALSLLWFLWGWRHWWKFRQQRNSLDLSPWYPLCLGLCAPWLMLKGASLGWERFHRELTGLTSLEPWEGLRAFQIVRHAVDSLISWSTPMISAGLACLLQAGALFCLYSLWKFDLYLRSRKKKHSELAEIREELKSLRQLLELQGRA